MKSCDAWNACNLPCPEYPEVMTALNKIMIRKVTAVREELLKVIQIIELECLHTEAATLSRFLYRNYRILKKDKSFQLLKMIMVSLNKYLRMRVSDDIQILRDMIPLRFTILDLGCVLPSREMIGWVLARIQATIALFYRIFQLCKKTGKQLYGRLRLLWNPAILIFGLALTARIFVISRYIVLQLVQHYEKLLTYIRTFQKTQDGKYSKCTRDIKGFFGGMDDVQKMPSQVTSTVDMTLQLIDLTEEDELSEFRDIFKNFQGVEQDEEVQRICEVVHLDATQRPSIVAILTEEEDIGEPVNEAAHGNVEIVEIKPRNSPVTGKRRHKSLNLPNKKIKVIETIDLSTNKDLPSRKKR